MKKCILVIIVLSIILSLFACGTTERSATTADERTAMDYFETLCKAVEADTSGTYSDIGTDASAAIVAIEKLYKRNSDSKIITQFYYYAEVISCIEISNISGSKYYDQGVLYANQIDQSYDGPYAREILSLANKYANKTDSSAKSALTMSSSEKAEVKAFIEARYAYYDELDGKYSGDKYTEQIWQEAAEKFGVSTADIDLIWTNR